ncbi:MAG: Tad domain-containing protein [Myxococcaceae bacterium]|nr:Tad domain-containing protein [Myxococcaceae bacterium]
MNLSRKSRRGQVMVLSVVTMLMLALMMTVGFNIAHTAHERIRIQSAADAQAYSVAVLQARSFNINAILNRTIAALTVAQMSLHAWNNIATHDVDMLNAGFFGFLGVSAYEAGVAKCGKFTPWHCWDALEALFIAFDYLNNKNDYEDKLESKESQFNEAVRQLYEAKKSLYSQERNLMNQVNGEIAGGNILRSMLRETAPQADYVGAFHGINTQNYKCSLSGPSISGCGGSAPMVFNRADVSPTERSIMMQNAANAARSLFNKMGGEGAMLAHNDFKGNGPFTVRNPPKMMDIQGSGQYNAMYIPGAFKSRVGQDLQGADPGHVAEDVGAASGFGFVNVQWRHGRGAWFLNSSVYSSPNGGQHQGAVGDNHNEFKTIAQNDNEATFITFRAHDNPSESNDWGQPNAYGGVTQDLRLMQNGGRGAYELNRQGKINVKIGNEQVRVTLVSENEGIAVAKAKAYFHQFGASWQLPPNGFDPFWFAKLHPFRRDELRRALNLAGDPNASVQGPVEGVE